MTLYEMSYHTYGADAAALRMRISELRNAARGTGSREEAERYRRRISELRPLLRQANELAALTRHYYERKGALR